MEENFHARRFATRYVKPSNCVKMRNEILKKAVEYLRAGKAVVFPTDTAYGLAVDATNPKAVKRLFQIKQRRPAKPVHIIIADLAMAKRYAKFTPVAEKLFKKFLPGPLTLILPLTPRLAEDGESRRASLSRKGRGIAFGILSAGTGTIGIRMPDNKIALALVRKLGRPITATSANISTSPTAYSISQIEWQFRSEKLKPDLVLDSGKLKKIQPSTMVRLKSGKIEIIRRGPISKKQILKVLKTNN